MRYGQEELLAPYVEKYLEAADDIWERLGTQKASTALEAVGGATCFLYARLAGRTPIVDWRDGFYAPDGEDAFQHLFVSRSAAPLSDLPDTDSVFPEVWRGRIDAPIPGLPAPVNARHPESRSAERLDLTVTDHDADVVVMFALRQMVEWLRPHMTGAHAHLARMESWRMIRSILEEEFAPHPDVRERVKRFRDEHLKGPTVGVHLRLSDKQTTRYEAVERRLSRLLRRRPGLTVFLATDNVAIRERIERTHRAVTAPQWFPEPGTPLHYGPGRDAVEVGRAALTDMLLLAGCDYVIGDRLSNFTKTAMALSDGRTIDLQTRRKRWPQPFVSAWRYLVPGPATPLALAAARRWAPYG